METIALSLATLLFATLAAGLWLVVRAPSPAESMLAAQLLGTTGVAVTLLLGHATGLHAAADVALVFALLSSVAAVTFVRRLGGRSVGEAKQ